MVVSSWGHYSDGVAPPPIPGRTAPPPVVTGLKRSSRFRYVARVREHRIVRLEPSRERIAMGREPFVSGQKTSDDLGAYWVKAEGARYPSSDGREHRPKGKLERSDQPAKKQNWWEVDVLGGHGPVLGGLFVVILGAWLLWVLLLGPVISPPPRMVLATRTEGSPAIGLISLESMDGNWYGDCTAVVGGLLGRAYGPFAIERQVMGIVRGRSDGAIFPAPRGSDLKVECRVREDASGIAVRRRFVWTRD